MQPEDVSTFFAATPPFHLLADQSRQNLISQLSEQFYSKDAVILQQDVHVCNALIIIKKGTVKLSVKSADGQETIVGYRGEHDNFGFLSVISEDKHETTVVATEDTNCYLLGREKVLELLGTNPEFTAHFLKIYITQRQHEAYLKNQDNSAFYGSNEHFLFVTQIGDIATRNVVTAPSTTSIHEVSLKMTSNQVDSLIVTDEKGRPLGIITDKDLRTRFIAPGRDPKASVDSIMSQPLIWVDAGVSCSDVMLKMIEYNIRHIPVSKYGKLQGMITNHDLLLFQGASPLSFAKDVERQQSVEGLASVATKINKIVIPLVKEGSKASNITKLITELNDSITRKILTIAEQKFGQIPVAYCWIAYGSEGRKEQSLKTDQDNAIIYADPLSSEDDKKIKKYFANFATFVCDGLVKCGFALCPANFMASNPKWCQPLRVWKGYFSRWINIPSTEATLRSLIFFDFRGLYGDCGLADELKNHLALASKGQKDFFFEMAYTITQNRPPLSILNNIIVAKTGEHKNKLDMKLRAIAPMVDIARLFAIEAGIAETATLDRIKLLKDKHYILQNYAKELEDAYEFVASLRIRHQTAQITAGKQPDNHIHLDMLSGLEKKTLTESFHVISKIQDAITRRYEPMFMLARH
ncbi:MAG: cyclic nucleotide-binding/CBS domain-containing protein [Desulfobulbaceae bacterium]|nr:MAG: cyclic nucleotide-binding/CBS domain-containing protein [Desulfobulbaceae bacterium]